MDYYHNIINNKINSWRSLGLVNFNIPLYQTRALTLFAWF